MRSFLSIVSGPALCLGVLGGIMWESGRHTKPADAAAYHATAKALIATWPETVGDWAGKDAELPRAAIQLLKPNAYFCRTFWNTQRRSQPTGGCAHARRRFFSGDIQIGGEILVTQ